MSYEESLAAKAAQQEQALDDEENKRGFGNIRRVYPWVENNQANYGILVSWFEPYNVSLEGFTLSLDDPAFIKKLAVAPPDAQRARLINEIIALVSSPDGSGIEGRKSTHAAQTEEIRLRYFTLGELTARYEEVVRRQSMQKKSVGELKEILRASVAPPGYPALPRKTFDQRKMAHVILDAAYIKSLDVDAIRRLNTLYSVTQVNDRLAGRD